MKQDNHSSQEDLTNSVKSLEGQVHLAIMFILITVVVSCGTWFTQATSVRKISDLEEAVQNENFDRLERAINQNNQSAPPTTYREKCTNNLFFQTCEREIN